LLPKPVSPSEDTTEEMVFPDTISDVDSDPTPPFTTTARETADVVVTPTTPEEDGGALSVPPD